MATLRQGKSVTVTLNTHNQRVESLQSLLKKVGGLVDCDHCGRMAILRIDFLSDPPPDLAKDGAISVMPEGF
jgi:hypothetical protein